MRLFRKHKERRDNFVYIVSQTIKERFSVWYDKSRFKVRCRALNIRACAKPKRYLYSLLGCLLFLFLATSVSALFSKHDGHSSTISQIMHTADAFQSMIELEGKLHEGRNAVKQRKLIIDKLMREIDSIASKESMNYEDSLKIHRNYKQVKQFYNLSLHEKD